jgi:hypothetical protein
MLRSPRVRAALLSLVVLIPCFWQSRIQVVDLKSHIYNSWLAQQIEAGKAPGLTIAPVRTNVLFDLILYRLFRSFGPAAAQRIAVSIAALIFFWGAFAMVSAASRTRPWFLVPCLLMLTYGWVFHMGFFNFYLAAGLSLWAVALSFRTGIVSWIGVAALLALACAGNALPPAWAIGAIAYRLVAQRLDWRGQLAIFGLAVGCIVGLSSWITAHFTTQSFPTQILAVTGANQVWVFGIQYGAISIVLVLLWSFLLLRLGYRNGFAETARDTTFQLCVLTSVFVVWTPARIQLPQYTMPFSYVGDRTTLLLAVLVCALLAAANPPKWLRVAFVPLAVAYFSCLYIDTNFMNKVEDRMEHLVSGLSAGDRIVSSLEDPISRIEPWTHNVDRVCLGKCVSYGNYEPVSNQFRVQIARPNPLVVANPVDFYALEDGGYAVKPNDLPLYQIALCGDRKELCLQSLAAGEKTRHDLLGAAPRFW